MKPNELNEAFTSMWGMFDLLSLQEEFEPRQIARAFFFVGATFVMQHAEGISDENTKEVLTEFLKEMSKPRER